MNKYINVIIKKTLFVICAILCSCNLPTIDGDPQTIGEQHSVWQYLSVHSIYQDRVPSLDESFDMQPQDMFLQISDTLRCTYYTWYVPLASRNCGGATPPPSRPPEIKALTDSTVYFGFFEFDDDEIRVFRNNIEYMSTFSNIIIDLRNNTGGYMSVATEIIEHFIPRGTEYIEYEYRNFNSQRRVGEDVIEIARATNSRPAFAGKNVAVLVNRFSASASEILASGLKDAINAHVIGGLTYEAFYDALDGLTNGFVVGIPTYGKARGQRQITRSGHRTLSITFMKIRGITERTGDYHNIGIVPDSIPLEELELAIQIINDEDYTASDIAEELLTSDSEIYFALKIFEPWIADRIESDDDVCDDIDCDDVDIIDVVDVIDVVNNDDDDKDESAVAQSRRNAVRRLGILEPIDPGAAVGVYVIDSGEL